MKEAILQFLKANGEQLDAQIAQALGMPIAKVTHHVAQLCAAGDVICCRLTRWAEGKKIEGVSCRLSGSVPARAPGPKPGAKQDSSPETQIE
jgi:predicted transcriptional regulator